MSRSILDWNDNVKLKLVNFSKELTCEERNQLSNFGISLGSSITKNGNKYRISDSNYTISDEVARTLICIKD